MATPRMYEDDDRDDDLSAAASTVSIHEGAVAIERRRSPPSKSTGTTDTTDDDRSTPGGGRGAAAAGLVVARTGLVKIVVQNWRKEVTLFCGELVQRNSLVTIYKVRYSDDEQLKSGMCMQAHVRLLCVQSVCQYRYLPHSWCLFYFLSRSRLLFPRVGLVFPHIVLSQ